MSGSQSTIQRARELGLPTNLEEAIRPAVPRLSADERIVRNAILEMFDHPSPDKPRFFFEGQPVQCAAGGYEHVSESLANTERLDFADSVIAIVRAYKRAAGFLTHAEKKERKASKKTAAEKSAKDDVCAVCGNGKLFLDHAESSPNYHLFRTSLKSKVAPA